MWRREGRALPRRESSSLPARVDIKAGIEDTSASLQRAGADPAFRRSFRPTHHRTCSTMLHRCITGRFFMPNAAVALAFALTAAAAPATAEVAGLSAERLLDGTRVADVSITLPDDDWKALRAQSRDMGQAFRGNTESPFTWFRGDVTIDGVAIGSVGIRKKGFLGSLDSSAPSLLVDFNRYVDQSPVDGLGRLTLNNNKQDKSLVSQALAYGVFRAAGLAAPRVGFAEVTVNGENLGLYSDVEPVRRPFLARAFGSAAGTLWEGTVCDIVPESADRLDVEIRGPGADGERLAALGAMLADEAPLDPEQVGALVDVDAFLRFWAVESLLNLWDGYSANQNNYFVYADPSDGLLRFVPWGADAALGPAMGGGPFAGRTAPAAVLAQAALPNRLYFTPGFADRYRATLESVMADVWREDDLLAEIDRLEKLLGPRLGPRQKDAPAAMERIREFVRKRRGEIDTAFAAWPAEAPSTWRRPMKSRPLGTATGSFAATYREGAVDEVPPPEVALEVVFDGATVGLEGVEASVSTFVFPGFGGGPQADPPISVVISATRADDGKPLAFNLFLDRRRVADDASVPVNGIVTEGTAGFGIPGLMPVRAIDGTFAPTQRGSEPGARLAGRLDLRVTTMEGGLMNRAPMMKPGDAAPPSPQAPPAESPPAG